MVRAGVGAAAATPKTGSEGGRQVGDAGSLVERASRRPTGADEGSGMGQGASPGALPDLNSILDSLEKSIGVGGRQPATAAWADTTRMWADKTSMRPGAACFPEALLQGLQADDKSTSAASCAALSQPRPQPWEAARQRGAGVAAGDGGGSAGAADKEDWSIPQFLVGYTELGPRRAVVGGDGQAFEDGRPRDTGAGGALGQVQSGMGEGVVGVGEGVVGVGESVVLVSQGGADGRSFDPLLVKRQGTGWGGAGVGGVSTSSGFGVGGTRRADDGFSVCKLFW